MTENKAIKRLQTLNIILTDKAGHKEDGIEKIFTFSDITAICKAIQALEEIQQYRAIGTVEDVAFYKKCYDEESYEYCGEYGTDNCGCKDRMEHLEKKIAEFEAIGTIEEFKALKEKNEPKKPDYEADGYADGELVYDYAKCPICGHDYEYGINDWECEYCSDCGQKLDWQ